MKAQLPLARIKVFAGDHIRINTPVQVRLEHLPIDQEKTCILKSPSGPLQIPCQVSGTGDQILRFVITDTLFPGQHRSFYLYLEKKESRETVSTVLDDRAITIYNTKKPVLQYYFATMYPPEGVDSSYKRSGFIHPLWSPAGYVLSRIQPPDHYHHYGLWNPWTKTLYEGRTIDFWNLVKNEGTVAHSHFGPTEKGPVYGGFQAHLDHIDKTAPGGHEVAIREKLEVGSWNVGPGKEWLIDYVSELRCGTKSSIILEQSKYAGFGFRACESWTNQNSWIMTSEGHTRKTADGSRGRWCMVYGETGTGLSGILFMGHPENRDFPEPMRIWPEEENKGRGDVFFNFCPVKEKDWVLIPDHTYILRYRMLVFEGTISRETAERLWNDFAHPPETAVELLKITNN